MALATVFVAQHWQVENLPHVEQVSNLLVAVANHRQARRLHYVAMFTFQLFGNVQLLFNSLRNRFNHAMEESQVFDVMGEEGFARLVSAFYQRVRKDDLIGPMYPDQDWEGAEQRLRDFLVYRFGGPDRYIQQQGHPRLRMRHAGFKIGVAERDRWIELMSAAMKESEVPKEVALNLRVFFEQVADFMRNVPEN